MNCPKCGIGWFEKVRNNLLKCTYCVNHYITSRQALEIQADYEAREERWKYLNETEEKVSKRKPAGYKRVYKGGNL